MINRIEHLQASLRQKHLPLVLSNCRVFFDFDNTLTQSDVLDDIIKKFSVNDRWKALEQSWVNGEIGTKECLIGQLKGLRASKKALDKYLDRVELDKNCYKTLSFLNTEGVRPVILSDNFTPIVEYILQCHGIEDVKVYGNALRFYKDRLIPSFPYDNPFCPSCAHCKKIHLTGGQQDHKLIVYVGDGRSDICPAQVSDIVFAKDSLLQHMSKIRKPCIAYHVLETVYNYFKEAVDGD